MITIDFPFFASMHERLRQPFNAADYTLEQLNILYNSQNMLSNREFCSEDFAMAANEYFANHKSELTKVVALTACDPYPVQQSINKIAAEFHSFESAMEYVETLKTKDHNVNDEEMIRIQTSESSDWIISVTEFTRQLNQTYTTRNTPAQNLKNYYEAWLNDKMGYNEGTISEMIDIFANIISSADSIENLISDFGQKETAKRLREDIGNRLWIDINTILTINDLLTAEQKIFFEKMIEYKKFDGLKLLLQAVGNSKQTHQFFATSDKDFTIHNETTAETFSEELTALLSIIDYDAMDLNHLTGKLDIESFKKLAEFYQMPQNIIEKLLTEELQDIKSDDNVSTIFASKNFQLSIPYTKANGQQGTKNYTVELLPKSDPTALFVGKMTNCCQFYTGHSSEQAVMPVYTDPNAGLVVVKEKGKVKGASFVWLTQDNGLVLDSFEHIPETNKAFLPFISALSNKLAESDHKLYLGSGGNTPRLHSKEENGELIEVMTTMRPQPLSEGFTPYGDSHNVYLIESGINYITTHVTIEENAIELITQKLSIAEQEDLKELYQKFELHNLKEIATYCLHEEYSFIQALQSVQYFQNNFRMPGFYTQLIKATRTTSEEKIALINQFPDFIKLLDKKFCSNMLPNTKGIAEALKEDITPADIETILKIASCISYFEIKSVLINNKVIDDPQDKILYHLIQNNAHEDKMTMLASLSNEDKTQVLSVCKKNNQIIHTKGGSQISFNSQNDLSNIAENVRGLSQEQIEKILSNQFLQNLLTKDPILLSYALTHINDEHLAALGNVSIYNKEAIENLVSNLKTLTPDQIEKSVSNYFLRNLLTKNTELLQYALDNIKDEDLPKLNAIWVWSKEQIENLANNLKTLNSEQIDMAISDNSITESYESIKDRFGIIDEVTNTIDGSEYKEIGSVIVTDPNAAQEWAESKIVGEDVYSADQL